MAYSWSSQAAARGDAVMKRRPQRVAGSSTGALPRDLHRYPADLAVSRFVHDGTATIDVASLAAMRRSTRSRSNSGSSSVGQLAEISQAVDAARLEGFRSLAAADRSVGRSTSWGRLAGAGRRNKAPTRSPSVTCLSALQRSQEEESTSSNGSVKFASPLMFRKTSSNKPSQQQPGSPSDCASAEQEEQPQPPAEPQPEPQAPKQQPKQKLQQQPDPERAAFLARKYRLELFEAKRLLKELDALHARKRLASFDDFLALVCKAYDIESTDHIPYLELKAAYSDVCVRGNLRDDSFFGWYMANLFSYPRTPQKAMDEALASLSADVFTVEHLKKIFYDISEGADCIDFCGFQKVVYMLLQAKAEHDVCERRIKAVWKELALSNGKVTFSDLSGWYFQCLADTAALEQTPDLALAESFYMPYTALGHMPRRQEMMSGLRNYSALALIAAGA